MGIGFSTFLLALGAILAFAVHATVSGLDLQVVGWVLMAAGALGLVLTMAVITPRRRRTLIETTREVADPTTTAQWTGSADGGPRV
jgi:Domain of unknown function (DUF6458)